MNEPTIAVTATREGLRQASLEGIARALAHSRLLGAEAVRLLEAQRAFWTQADFAHKRRRMRPFLCRRVGFCADCQNGSRD